jgi:hypothetical protein
MAYLLDSNVLITAKRIHYGFDFCPGFWDWIVAGHGAGRVFSIESVFDELRDQQDDLAEWVRALPNTFFLAPDAGTVAHFQSVSTWVSGQRYRTPAINEFLQTADYHLIAQAKQGGHTVVTYEVPGGSEKRVKIPDVCLGVQVGCVLPHEMLRRSRSRFVLGATE